MKLINWTPANVLFNIFDNIDECFDYAVQNNYRKPNVSINDEGNNYSISLEMPGIDKKDINITVNDGIVSIDTKQKEGNNQSTYSEIDNYSRSFYIPDDGNQDKIKAKSLNGILAIEIPKLKAVNKNIKKIAIS